VPTPASGEVSIRMRNVGICHSDVTLLGGDYIIPFGFPVVPGHEWTGEVLEVGTSVLKFKPGDRVVGECAVSDTAHFGFTMDGALSEVFLASTQWLHHLPESINDTAGALVEPFTIAYRATANIDASDTVVVFGAGPIGLCAVASAAAQGARVVIVEPQLNRHPIAMQLGAELALDPSTNNVADEVAALTGLRGADLVIEGSGHPSAMAAALELARFGGRVVYVGINPGAEVFAPLGLLVTKALRVQGNVGSAGIWPAALRFLERTGIDLAPMVSASFPLSQAVEALSAANDRSTNIKVHIHGERL